MLRRTRLTLIVLAAGFACPSAASAGSETIEYTYDTRGRLVKVFHTAPSTVNPNHQVCYKYDKAGNRVKVTLSPTSGSAPPACPS